MNPLFVENYNGIEITARASKDNLKLFLDAKKLDKKSKISRLEILDLLRVQVDASRVDTRLIDDIVHALLSGKNEITNRRVLVGEAPKHGQDGQLILYVKPFALKPDVKEEAAERQKLTQLDLFDNITAGKVIGRVYPPKPGSSGVDIYGNEITSVPGKRVQLNVDQSITIKEISDGEDGYQMLIAEQSGYLIHSDGHLSIRSTLHINNDLDFHWGDIDFIGSVKVQGDVMQGFTIKAKNGIEILGSVRGGSLISTEGNVNVRNYVYGGHQSMIMAGKNFYASVAQEVHAEVIGDIYIQKEANNCTLRTAGFLYMPDGALVGGEVFTCRGIEAHTIGSEVGTRTLITLSSDVEASLAFSKILIEMELSIKEIKILRLKLGPVADILAQGIPFDRSKYERVAPLVELYEKYLSKLRALQHQKRQMMMNAKTKRLLRTNFMNCMYEGVVVRCEGKEFTPPQTISGPVSLDFDLRTKRFYLQKIQALPTYDE